MTNYKILSLPKINAGGRARLGFSTYSERSILKQALTEWRWKDNLDLSPYGKAV